jgi:hypothetical protein
MKPRAFVLLLGIALVGVALGTPLYAQSRHASVGGAFAVSPQYPQYPQGPPSGGYGYPQSPGSAPYPDRTGNGRGRGDGSGYGSGNGYDDYARSTGYRDGYDQGFDASRDRDRFDPRRERWYREGDRGYKRDAYMTRDRYKDVYRRGFLEGYQAGYRDARRGDYRSGGNGWPFGWR